MANIKSSFRIDDIIVYNCNFLQTNFPKNKFDLIITSPPYNIGIDYGTYIDSKTYEQYIEFSQDWLKNAYEVLKDDGRICINIPIDVGKFGKYAIAADLTKIAKECGFNYKGTIIWNKQNSSNKFSMVFSKNIEVILIFYKKTWKPIKKEFREWVNEIWQFSGENPKRVAHPAAFPMELPRRLIKMMSIEGDLILDPFVGSGTTLAICKQLKRKGVGVEIDEKFFKMIKKRISIKKVY